MEVAQKPVAEMRFREAMDELESIVTALEANDMELEDSLKSYERGVALLSSLKTRLADAEQRVEVLMGELSQTPDDETQDTTLS